MTILAEHNRILDSVHNLRDYGGYAVSGGGRVAVGKLWRSGQLHGATAADIAHIDALDLRAIVDLRGPKERIKAPNPPLPQSDPRSFETNHETANLIFNVKPDDDAAASVAMVDAAMGAGYRVMPFNPALIEIMTAHFSALATIGGAQLIHCLAGKDRTGLTVALTQHLLGVHFDDINADYLLTNSAGNIEARIEAGARAIRRVHRDDLPLAAIRVLMGVRDEYLACGWGAMNEQHGSIDAYLRVVLGVDEPRAAAIRANYLVS